MVGTKPAPHRVQFDQPFFYCSKKLDPFTIGVKLFVENRVKLLGRKSTLAAPDMFFVNFLNNKPGKLCLQQ